MNRVRIKPTTISTNGAPPGTVMVTYDVVVGESSGRTSDVRLAVDQSSPVYVEERLMKDLQALFDALSDRMTQAVGLAESSVADGSLTTPSRVEREEDPL